MNNYPRAFQYLFTQRQEQLAGTDGLESFRQAFFSQSRLVVVLYHDGWGKTRWTAVEELAIKERMFNGGWKPLLFVMLDKRSTYPACCCQMKMWHGFSQSMGFQSRNARWKSSQGALPLALLRLLSHGDANPCWPLRLSTRVSVESIFKGLTQ